MHPAHTNPLQRSTAWRRLPVDWLECPGARSVVFLSQRKTLRQHDLHPACPPHSLRRGWGCLSRSRPSHPFSRAFTILELLIVVGIIGFMAAMALPHLSGFTKGNSMVAATRQLLDDVSLARQRALVNRSQVCMVFLPPNFWNTATAWPFPNTQITNLYSHQYSAYALIALRTVGDQPGRFNVHYLTDWKYLPQGVYISPFQFTNNQGLTNWISTTNTTIGLSNGWPVSAFPTNILFPFPSTFTATANSNYLPYICFTPSGQLTSGVDQFIMLTSGSIFYSMDANGLPVFTSSANVAETPPGNAFNNPNLIHIDWLTARAKIERNQF